MPKHIEDLHQETLFSWANWQRVQLDDGSVIKLSDALYAIPNGGKRNQREAARLKRQGVKAGVSDTHLPIPVGSFHGLWIELKKPFKQGQSKPKVTENQKDWLELVKRLGHLGVVAYGVDQAKHAIKTYLGDRLIDNRRSTNPWQGEQKND